MSSNFNFTVTFWFLGNVHVKPYFTPLDFGRSVNHILIWEFGVWGQIRPPRFSNFLRPCYARIIRQPILAGYASRKYYVVLGCSIYLPTTYLIVKAFKMVTKTVTFVRRPKMKRDSEMLSFYYKKTAFHSGISLHFQATNRRYGFSSNICLITDFIIELLIRNLISL